MLLDLADFALQEQLKDNLLIPKSRAWYNGIALYNDPVFNNSFYSLDSDLFTGKSEQPEPQG